MRGIELEYLKITGMVEGKRDRGRQQRENMTDGVMKWHEERTPVQIIINSQNMEMRKNITTSVCWHGTG